jgi:hypothetical protein
VLESGISSPKTLVLCVGDWVVDVLIVTRVSLILGTLCGQNQEIYIHMLTHIYTRTYHCFSIYSSALMEARH